MKVWSCRWLEDAKNMVCLSSVLYHSSLTAVYSRSFDSTCSTRVLQIKKKIQFMLLTPSFSSELYFILD